MKTRILIMVLFAAIAGTAWAQTPKLAVIGVDVQAKELKGQNLPELFRIELGKHNAYQLIDRYEVDEVLSKNSIDPNSCFSRTCLLNAAQLLKADKVAAGNVDLVGESLYIRLRVLDVKANTIEKEVVKQFINVPEKISPMITITVNELLGIQSDEALIRSLSSRSSYENAVNNPHINTLDLEGPRMGYTFLTGTAAEVIQKPEKDGGYDGYPALFQFGYQFEKQYLSEGKFQALVEFIPMISGLDQGLLIPSLTVMNGLRNNVNGIEFAIGPSINLVKEATWVRYNGKWFRPAEFTGELPDGAEEVKRMDSNGALTLKSYVVIAAGFSFRSGRMNIPVNAYVVPAKNSMRFGFSFGFNSRG